MSSDIRLKISEKENPIKDFSIYVDKEEEEKVGIETLKTTKIGLNEHQDKDSLNYNLYAEVFAEVIVKQIFPPPITFGIYAPWGSGKTILIKLIKRMQCNVQIIN